MQNKTFLQKFIREIKYALKPGVTPFLIQLARFSIGLLMIFAISMIYINGSIHFYVLTFLSIGLFLSFEYSVIYMKRCPEFFNSNEKIAQMEKEEIEKKKRQKELEKEKISEIKNNNETKIKEE